MLTGTNFLSHSFGILLVYVFGAFMEWNVVSGITAVLPLLSLAAFILLPESPVWLVRNNKIEEAEKALIWLRGGGVGIQVSVHLFISGLFNDAISSSNYIASNEMIFNEQNKKAFLTPRHLGRCCANVIQGHCYVLCHFCINVIEGHCCVLVMFELE